MCCTSADHVSCASHHQHAADRQEEMNLADLRACCGKDDESRGEHPQPSENVREVDGTPWWKSRPGGSIPPASEAPAGPSRPRRRRLALQQNLMPVAMS